MKPPLRASPQPAGAPESRRRFPAFDVILASSPPIFTAAAGYAISRLRRRPWIFEIRDLWPQSIVEVGALDPDAIHLPGVYVQRLVIGAPYDKKIEFRTVRQRENA